MPAASTIGRVAPSERPVAMTTVCDSAARCSTWCSDGVIAPSWSTSVPSTSRPISRCCPARPSRCSSRRARVASRSVVVVVEEVVMAGSVASLRDERVNGPGRSASNSRRKSPGAGISGSAAREREDLATAERGGQARGHHDRAVGPLVVLEDRGEEARGAERAVEGGDGAQPVLGALADVQPARLELGGVRGGGQLAVGVLAGHPRLTVELAGGGGAEGAGGRVG